MNANPPRSSRPAAPHPRRTPRRRRALGSLSDVRVLVVEDDPASRKLAMVLLTTAGAQVVGVESAEEALTTIDGWTPDVALVDLVLPRMGGLALIEELKQQPKTEAIVVVAVTSLNGPEVERVVLASGCAAYVRKPIDGETFVATIATSLGGER